MKKFILIIFVLLINKVFGQNKLDNHLPIDTVMFRCTYLFSFQTDSTNKFNIGNEKMILFIGNRYSRFKSQNRLVIDSLLQSFRDNSLPPSIALSDLSIFPIPKYEHQIFKNYPEGELSVFDRIGKDKYVYHESMNCFNWKIQPDKFKILGYNCQKAVTNYRGRNYIAWFTNEIPISEGPYKFHGLPGLILNISDTKNHYSWNILTISIPREEILLYYPSYKTICTSNKEFQRAKLEANQNIIQRLEDMGGSFASPEARENAKRRAIEKMNKRNNPIELIIE